MATADTSTTDAAQNANAATAATANAPGTPADTTTQTTSGAVDQAASPASDAVPAADWATMRAKYAGEDEKILKRLERYSSTEAALDALIAAQNKISSGSLKAALPKDATPEQLEEWRKDNGLPPTPEDYNIDLSQYFDDENKELVSSFLEASHTANMTPSQVEATMAWLAQQYEEADTAQYGVDEEAKNAASAKLKEEWGSEYTLNLNLVANLLNGAPEGVRDRLLNGRLSDGTPVGSDPAVARWLANIAREVNPVATVVPGSGGNAVQALESEMAQLNKMMGDYNSEYWKGPMAERHQSRYLELLRVKEKIKR